MTRGRRSWPVLLVLAAWSLSACERSGEEGDALPRGEPGAQAPAAPVAPSPNLAYDTVFVYFHGPAPDGEMDGPLVARPRAVPDGDALTFALEELLAGPTEADRSGGPLYSWFSHETEGMLRDVYVADGVAVVEFGDFRSLISGASSSAGSAMLMGQLGATVFQFPEVERAEFRIDGSCDELMAWIQMGCIPWLRSAFTPPAGYRMAVPGGRAKQGAAGR